MVQGSEFSAFASTSAAASSADITAIDSKLIMLLVLLKTQEVKLGDYLINMIA